MNKFKVRLYDQTTCEVTYGYVWAYTWAEAERKAESEFRGYVTSVENIEC